MNRQIEQKQWDALCKIVRCQKTIVWKCKLNSDEWELCLYESSESRKKNTIYIVTADAETSHKTPLTNGCYVTDIIWQFLKKGFDEWKEYIMFQKTVHDGD